MVTLRARPLESGVRIEVADQGPGIPPGERVRVFDRFDRGSRQAADGGTGLGLAIARWVVDLHGGRISVAEPAGSAAPTGGSGGSSGSAEVERPVESITSGAPEAAAGSGAHKALKSAPGCVIRVDLP